MDCIYYIKQGKVKARQHHDRQAIVQPGSHEHIPRHHRPVVHAVGTHDSRAHPLSTGQPDHSHVSWTSVTALYYCYRGGVTFTFRSVTREVLLACRGLRRTR